VAPWDRSTPWAAKGRVAGPALLERGLELIEETLGPVDILVNNGGIALKKDALDVSIEEWSQVLSVNPRRGLRRSPGGRWRRGRPGS
jgi:NAD(P)-dependent dehydrogenase (short-subunit alcohol dehydrogenase family)